MARIDPMIDSLHTVELLVLVSPQLRLHFPYTLDYLHNNGTMAFHDKDGIRSLWVFTVEDEHDGNATTNN